MSEVASPQQRHIAVIFGGPSNEHEVSLASAQSVLRQLQAPGWDVLTVGVGKDGRWYVGPDALWSLVRQADPALLPLGVEVPEGEPVEVRVYDRAPGGEVFAGYQVAFPVSHGQWGEDGTLQGLLSSYGLTIVGCGVTASAVCFDKRVAKAVLTGAGLPVTPGFLVTAQDWASDRSLAQQKLSEGPWFVKPNRGGSSIGVIGPVSAAELPAAIDATLAWDDAVLVEEYIPHRELLVGVLGSEKLTVSPPLEAIQQDEVLAYEEKYLQGRLRFAPPAGLSAEILEQVDQIAHAAFRALGCDIIARVDFFVDTRSGRLMINEVNTIPGLTASSVFAQLMGAAGIPYAGALEQMFDLAEEKRR
jgi:D-alanine-D-alanine ligase